jgi:hypothetical protein
MPRQTRFELHIRPLIRELDRLHMLAVANLDLWDPQQVATNSARILRWLEGKKDDQIMPPKTHGGPWPAEWILLFYRWMREGQLSLDLAEGSYQAQRNNQYVTVTATGQAPGPNYSFWLDIYYGPKNANLVLYQEPPDHPVAQPTPFQVNDTFIFAPTVTSLALLDNSGLKTVPIT